MSPSPTLVVLVSLIAACHGLKLPSEVHAAHPVGAPMVESIAKKLLLSVDHAPQQGSEGRMTVQEEFTVPAACRAQYNGYVNLFRSQTCVDLIFNFPDDTSTTESLTAFCGSSCYAPFVTTMLSFMTCYIQHSAELTPSERALVQSVLQLIPSMLEWACTRVTPEGEFCNLIIQDPLYNEVTSASTVTSGNVSVYTTNWVDTPAKCAKLEFFGCCSQSYAEYEERLINAFFDGAFAEYSALKSKKLYYAFVRACDLGELLPCIAPGAPRKVIHLRWRVLLTFSVYSSADETKKGQLRTATRKTIADRYNAGLGEVEMGDGGITEGSWVINARVRGATDAETEALATTIMNDDVSTFNSSSVAAITAVDPAVVSGPVSLQSSATVTTEGQLATGSSKSGSSAGLIAGVTIAVVIVVAAAGVATWHFWWKPRQANSGSVQRMSSEGEMTGVAMDTSNTPLPIGWVEEQDPKTGVYTWRNEATGQIVWDRPSNTMKR